MFFNIDAERARIGMTRTKLAEEVGVDINTIASYISEKTAIPSTALCKMADLFGVSTDYLLGRSDMRNGV